MQAILLRLSRRMSAVLAAATVAGFALATDRQDAAPSETQTVRPVECMGVIKNPGVGYQTFSRPAATDAQIPSSTMYVRVDWSDVEPAPGVYKFAPIDEALRAAQAAGQRLAFRIMGYEEGNGGPVGLRKAGFRGFSFNFAGVETWFPDLDDDDVQRDLARFIAALGERFGHNPGIDSVDVGLIGDWGEQHFWRTDPAPPYPSSKTLLWLAKQFKAQFEQPAIVNDGMWENDSEAFREAIRIGLGWRADCWGGRREMAYKYPRVVADVPAAWRIAPVIMEPCGVMATWIRKGAPWREALQWAVDNHVSEISNKSAPIPAEMLADVRNMLAKLGYRFVLRRATLPIVAQAGDDLHVQLDWENVGNAPMYFDRHVLVKIGPKVIDSGITMQGFLPGQRRDDLTVRTNGSSPGRYSVQIGLAPPRRDSPDIALAIQGEGPWYPLGTVELRNE